MGGISLHVLFVCTGNICRSPTAERLAAAYAAELGMSDFATASAGVRATVGHPIHPHAELVLRKLGGDSSGFLARQFTSKVAYDSDLILTMTDRHRHAVLEKAPKLLHRTFTLAEAAQIAVGGRAASIADMASLRAHVQTGEAGDVPDPIGQGSEIFESVGAQIADLVRPTVELCRSLMLAQGDA